MDISALLQLLRDCPDIQHISFETVLSFITRASTLKRDIMQPQPLSVPIDQAPEYLPPSMSQFLSDSLAIHSDHVHVCWGIFKDVIWDQPTPSEVRQADKDAFRIHGTKRGLCECSTANIASVKT